jgi:hypothetical protein
MLPRWFVTWSSFAQSSFLVACPLPVPYKGHQVTSADPLTMKLATAMLGKTSGNLHYTAESQNPNMSTDCH